MAEIAPRARSGGAASRGGRALHVFAVVVAAATLCLIAAGGLVTSTESGLSVPDWPTTYGHNMFTFPVSKWVGGIRFEHTHRLIASAVGLLTIVLAVWLARSETRRFVRRLGYLALAAVVAQGILGGITVIYLLPTAVSVAHACLAQLFFCLTVAIAVLTAPRWKEAEPAELSRAFRHSGVARIGAAAAGVVFLQLLVGAVMRHTKAGLAIPDFPLSLGRVIPPLDSFPVAIHFLHRVGALAVAVLAAACAVTAFRSGRAGLRRASVILCALVAVQIALGALTVLSARAVVPTTAHVAAGALVLAVAVSLSVGALAADRRLNNVVPIRAAVAGRAAGWK